MSNLSKSLKELEENSLWRVCHGRLSGSTATWQQGSKLVDCLDRCGNGALAQQAHCHVLPIRVLSCSQRLVTTEKGSYQGPTTTHTTPQKRSTTKVTCKYNIATLHGEELNISRLVVTHTLILSLVIHCSSSHQEARYK